ncbi:hypothetical protein ACH5RR_028428 [Cinchona calisaya]|uniref:Uncharacterized protein n=1 Tax=Cinchona calisaya TaxID=153742 RepID=A0ABD2YT77_9GENT
MSFICVDPVIQDLKFLQSKLQTGNSIEVGFYHVRDLKHNLQFLKPFLLCARKLINNNQNSEPVVLQPFLSSIENTISESREYIQSLRHGWESSSRDLEFFISLMSAVSHFQANIKSLEQKVIKAYITLSDYCSSSQSSSCCLMADDELVEFIDSILKNLVHLLSSQHLANGEDYNDALHSQIEALQEKLTFLKNFIAFAKFSLYVNGSDVDDDSPDCCAMLVNINSGITLIKAQVTGSGMIESPAAYRMLDERREVTRKNSNLMITSKVKIPSNNIEGGITDEA